MKNVTTVIVSTLFAFLFVEVCLRVDNSVLGDGLIFAFPSTELRRAALIERGLIPADSEIEFLESSIGGHPIPLVKVPKYSSRCHLHCGERRINAERFFLISAANIGPNLFHHARTVS